MVHANPIFVLSGHAVAQGVEGRRDGARHRLLVLVRAPDLDTAAPRATGITLQHGFHYLTIEQGSQMDMSVEDAPQEYLKAAILKAEESGQAIIVYDEELPPNG
jgi:hypothetical protein